MSKEYSQSKMELIRTYSDSDIINMIDSIKNHKELNKIFDIYVPREFSKKKNNNIKKYGDRTKQAFVNGLKGCPKDVIKSRVKEFQKLSENAYTIIYKIYLQELFDNIKELDNFSVEDILYEEAIDILAEINNDKHCPKEYIENWYKYNPYVDKNEDIEKKIENLTYTLSDLKEHKNLKEIDSQNAKIEKLNNAIDKLQKQLKEKENENEELRKEINNQREIINNLNNNIKQIQSILYR